MSNPTTTEITATIARMSAHQIKVMVAVETNSADRKLRNPARPTRVALSALGLFERNATGQWVTTKLGDAVGAALVAPVVSMVEKEKAERMKANPELANLKVGDRVTATRGHGVYGSTANREFVQIVGTVDKLLGASISIRAISADDPENVRGYLMFAEAGDVTPEPVKADVHVDPAPAAVEVVPVDERTDEQRTEDALKSDLREAHFAIGYEPDRDEPVAYKAMIGARDEIVAIATRHGYSVDQAGLEPYSFRLTRWADEEPEALPVGVRDGEIFGQVGDEDDAVTLDYDPIDLQDEAEGRFVW